MCLPFPRIRGTTTRTDRSRPRPGTGVRRCTTRAIAPGEKRRLRGGGGTKRHDRLHAGDVRWIVSRTDERDIVDHHCSPVDAVSTPETSSRGRACPSTTLQLPSRAVRRAPPVPRTTGFTSVSNVSRNPGMRASRRPLSRAVVAVRALGIHGPGRARLLCWGSPGTPDRERAANADCAKAAPALHADVTAVVAKSFGSNSKRLSAAPY